MKPIKIIVIASVLVSCKMYAVKKYHLQSSCMQCNKKMYQAFIHGKKAIDSDKVLYIDSSSYNKFLNETYIACGSPILIGYYLNDSTLLKTSSFLNENASCSGRIEKEIEAPLLNDNFEIQKKAILPKISTYSFRFIKNDSLFDCNINKNNLVAFVAISYSFGSYYDDLYKALDRLSVTYKDKLIVYFVVVDAFWRLK